MGEVKLPHNHGSKDEKLRKLSEDIKLTDEFRKVSDTFKLLDDSSRLRIFYILCHSEECVINIAALMDMTTPAVSHHLKLLKSGGLIQSRREGKEVYYKASDDKKAKELHKYIEKIMDIVCPQGR